MNNLRRLIRFLIALLLLPISLFIILFIAITELITIFGYWLFDKPSHDGYEHFQDTRTFIVVFTHWLRFQD